MEVASEIGEVVLGSPQYPSLLTEISDPPRALYVRGDFDFSEPSILIAMVGSRKPSAYGLQVVNQLVRSIARQSVVVSGLAYGIDAAAHKAALAAGGKTVAVLGTGVDDASIYPATNVGLAHEIIASGGALISEYKPGTGVQRYHFPQRNRIITGSLGLDYNREVLAVPGMITSHLSAGTNRLIAEGARPVLSAKDILDFQSVQPTLDLTSDEEIVYNTLMSGPKTVDEIIQSTHLSSAQVNSLLTLMEIKGSIKNFSNNMFGRVDG